MIGDELRKRRGEAGLTQRDLSVRAGVSRLTVIKAESGGNVTLETAVALAGALGVPVDSLIGGEE